MTDHTIPLISLNRENRPYDPLFIADISPPLLVIFPPFPHLKRQLLGFNSEHNLKNAFFSLEAMHATVISTSYLVNFGT